MIKIFPQSNSLEFTNALVKTSVAYELGQIHKQSFANGEISVVIDESVRNEGIVIVSQARTYEDIFELLETIDAARRASAKEIIGIVPCLPHSRQERRESGVRTTISARLLADMLQVAGLDRLITMDVHTTAIEGFYKIPFDNLDPSEFLVEKITNQQIDKPMIISPDLGGMKRAKKFAKLLNTDFAVIDKVRTKANEVDEMTLLGSVQDRNVILVDDMIDTGGTLLKALDLLKANGAKKCYIVAVHGIFSNGACAKFENHQSKVLMMTTNTIPNQYIGSILMKMNVANVFHTALKKIFTV